MGRRSRNATALVLGALLALGAVTPAAAEEKRHSVKNAAKEGAKTGGRTAKEGVLAFGRSTKAFFTGGPKAAKEAWKAGAAKTKRTAKAGARATKKAARGEAGGKAPWAVNNSRVLRQWVRAGGYRTQLEGVRAAGGAELA